MKLALHRLGSKGQLELQRGAPTWWKCTWLLNLLGIRFTESVKDREHYEMLKRLVQDMHHVFVMSWGGEAHSGDQGP